MPREGIEPSTLRSSAARSPKLSYRGSKLFSKFCNLSTSLFNIFLNWFINSSVFSVTTAPLTEGLIRPELSKMRREYLTLCAGNPVISESFIMPIGPSFLMIVSILRCLSITSISSCNFSTKLSSFTNGNREYIKKMLRWIMWALLD